MANPVSVPLRGMFPGGNTGQGGIVAAAGGGQANAVLLPATVNRVDTVVTAADSVLLPSAVPGAIVFAYNYAANSMQVFGQVSNKANLANPAAGDVIVPAATSAPAATATGVAQAGNTPAIYACAVVGEWKQFLCVT